MNFNKEPGYVYILTNPSFRDSALHRHTFHL